MATPTAAAARRYAGQDSNNSAIPPLRPQPSSPTLTNPDMILPDYDNPESLPPLDSALGRLQHVSLGWLDESDQMFAQYGDNMDDSTIYPLSTPIIYGNGTMLSDIGEVTEVESNAGGLSRRLSGRSSYSDFDVTARISSPAAVMKQFIRRTPHISARDARASVESINITPTVPDAALIDIDDSISVDDSNFQGDDEESIASSYFPDAMPAKLALRSSASQASLSEDRYSTMSISKRAEQILANAKRRLTAMEGNLTRARTFSYSSPSDASSPSPVRFPTPKQLQPTSHWRNVSQNSLLSTTPTQTTFPPRSASALGAAGGYRKPLPLSRSADTVSNINSMSQHALDLALETLSEDGGGARHQQDNSDSTQVGQYQSPTMNGYTDAGLPRSVSAAQMRGIQDQVNGLKGKIFSLREQAAADSMKRRSLQNLRQQSLFTNAHVDDQDLNSKTAHTPEQQHSPALGSPFKPEFAQEQIEQSSVSDHVQKTTPSRPRSERDMVVARHSPVQNLHEAYLQDEHTWSRSKAVAVNKEEEESNRLDKLLVHAAQDDENGDAENESGNAENESGIEAAARDMDTSDSVSEDNDSLYHDSHQHPISHEDREDAFDYEHFFLHSAMGHLSRQGYVDDDEDSASESSQESVATTRAAPTTGPGQPRRPSLDTVTSVDTFATATEGRLSRNQWMDDDDDGEDGEDGADTETGERESPVIGVADKRHVFGAQGSGSSSEGSPSSPAKYENRRSFSYRPTVMAAGAVGSGKRAGLQRPSVSSFESVGTNRSFPLINKARPYGSTPGGSPDIMMRSKRNPGEGRRSSLNEQILAKANNLIMASSGGGSVSDRNSFGNGTNGSVKDGLVGGSLMMAGIMTNGHGNSVLSLTSMRPLKDEDQASVDQLLASIQKCVLGLRDTSASGMKMHDTYRRRLEAARLTLEGDPDSF